MTTSLATTNGADIIEQVVIKGDLARLEPHERVSYYRHVCHSLGLNELTKPFEYITLNNKLTLYATRTATDQLRDKKGVSVTMASRELNTEMGIYTVEVKASTPDGRVDFATGVVTITNLRGDALANALMKAETKAKRRATLSICGLGWMDETELDTVPSARRTPVDERTGEIVDAPPASYSAPRQTETRTPPHQQPGSSDAPQCDVCGATGRPSKNGKGFFCPNKDQHGGKWYTIPEQPSTIDEWDQIDESSRPGDDELL